MNTFSYVGGGPLRYLDVFGLEWMVGKELNEKLANSFSFAICDNENPSVHIAPQPGYKCSAILTCVEIHERAHLNDALRSKPGICKGVKGRYWIGSNDDRERLQSESDAYYAEFECFRKARENACTNCQKEIDAFVHNLETNVVPLIYQGTYPSPR